MYSSIILAGVGLSLMLVDYLYHHPNSVKDRTKSLTPASSLREYQEIFKTFRTKKYDDVVGFFPYLANYCYILAAISLYGAVSNVFVHILLVLFVSGRFKSLQEIGHNALHGSLCRTKELGLWLTNLFYQYPLFKPDVTYRYKNHVTSHHPFANVPSRDPNLDDFAEAGLREGISKLGFWICVFYPLTPRGIYSNLISSFRNALFRNTSTFRLLVRLAVVGTIVTLFVTTGHLREFVLLYLVPLFIFYPLFAWISQVAEHRWFLKAEEDRPWLEREIEFGRPTTYPGFTGFLVRENIFPFGDAYHLAHSLFPFVRWNYLPLVDYVLRKNNFLNYNKNATTGLFFRYKGHHSALSELEERLVTKQN